MGLCGFLGGLTLQHKPPIEKPSSSAYIFMAVSKEKGGLTRYSMLHDKCQFSVAEKGRQITANFSTAGQSLHMGYVPEVITVLL